jgi:UDP-N-acetylglucosamine 1-carboxyvinyltransferase
VFIEGAIADHLTPITSKLQEMGVTVAEYELGIRVSVHQPLHSVDLKTLPYPGFPTDMQSQMMALLMVTEGTSIVTETVFENRFMHVTEFNNMNAQIKVDGRTAIISGQTQLFGAKVNATDLRAGAGLILAALAAEGETEISGLSHIDRGYVNITSKMKGLGADISRVEPEGLNRKGTESNKSQNNKEVFVVQPTLA